MQQIGAQREGDRVGSDCRWQTGAARWGKAIAGRGSRRTRWSARWARHNQYGRLPA